MIQRRPAPIKTKSTSLLLTTKLSVTSKQLPRLPCQRPVELYADAISLQTKQATLRHTQPLVLIERQKTRMKEANSQEERGREKSKQTNADEKREGKKTDYERDEMEKDKRDESKCAPSQTSIHSTVRKLLREDFEKGQWAHQRTQTLEL